MKNLSKSITRFLSIGVLLLLFSGCKHDVTPKYEDFDEDDFLKVPAVVTKITRTPVVGNKSHFRWDKFNVYYAYNLESDSILVGKEMDIDLALNEGDGFYIFVHKKDKGISFIAGSHLLPKDEKILERYLKKSKENGVKYYGVE
ncbi:hypothetical protein [Allomuricauda sp. ARW1Y1]|uniref:hypothetical protein n=1 Tax=Allomuricauda sp. ARW1Y1 TaxID=2663843 RepID=UPI0015C90DD7|nr:hypothetical protein [Muricauda sp. ARW1Y1]NYJ27612.1 hypothetical protein [Muricauda sp. ARW1Y1]